MHLCSVTPINIIIITLYEQKDGKCQQPEKPAETEHACTVSAASANCLSVRHIAFIESKTTKLEKEQKKSKAMY